MSLTTGENKSVTLGKDRHTVCLQAAWELEALAFLLPTLVTNIDEGSGEHYAVRGIASRVLALSNVLMSALGDEVVTTRDLEEIIFVTSKFSRIAS